MPKEYPMDLGRSFDPPEMVCVSEEEAKENIHYPTVYLEGDEFAELPKEGVLVAKFKVVSKTIAERDGEKRVSCDVELRKLLDVKAKDNPEPQEDRESALDKIRDELDY